MRFENLESKLNNYSYIKVVLFFCFGLLSYVAIVEIFSFIFNVEIGKSNPITKLDTFQIFFGAIFFAPIVETLIYQVIMIEGIYKLKESLLRRFRLLQYRFLYALIVPAIIFAISHSFGLAYILVTFFSGIILNYLYLYSRKRFGTSLAFIACLTVHALNNAVAFAFIFLER